VHTGSDTNTTEATTVFSATGASIRDIRGCLEWRPFTLQPFILGREAKDYLGLKHMSPLKVPWVSVTVFCFTLGKIGDRP